MNRSIATVGFAVLATLASLMNPSPAWAQTPGLVAAYAFSEGSGTTVADISGNNNNGTISAATWTTAGRFGNALDRKSTRLNSSHLVISYAVFCLKKKKIKKKNKPITESKQQ